MPPVRFGVHLSLGPNPEVALREASEYGARAAQIFASSPGAWKPPLGNPDRVRAIRDTATGLGMAPLTIHAIYLINLASPDAVLRARSLTSLVATMHAAADLGARIVTTHIGSHGGRGFNAVAPVIAAGLIDVLEQTPPAVDLALENSAGAGNLIGSTLDELGQLLDLARRPRRLTVTLDTAHLCGAGWALTQPDTVDRLVREIECTIGLDRLALLHANDSRSPCGSRRDRHAVVGEGHVGQEGFRHLLAQPVLRAVPWLLETPDLGEQNVERRYRSLATLRRLDREVRDTVWDANSRYDASDEHIAGV